MATSWRQLTARLRQLRQSAVWGDVFGLDVRSLALFRLALGALTIADVLQRAQDLTAHYTDLGVLPRGPLILNYMHYAACCLHLMTGTAAGIGMLFALHALLGLCLLLGYKSRSMAFMLWFMTYGVHLRNPMVLQGGDNLLRMLLFWGMFLPLGARFSIDAALHHQAGSCSLSPGLAPTAVGPRCILAWASTAFVGQQILVYACASLLKTGAPWHAEGSAVYYALNYDQLAKPLGLWLRQYAPLLPYLTHMTFALEATAPILLLCPRPLAPLRTAAIGALMVMHHSFAACLVLGLFPWIDTAGLVALLPGWFWDKLAARIDWSAQRRVVIYYDEACDFCKKMVQVLRQFLLLGEVQTQPAQSQAQTNALMLATDSWVVRGGDDELLTGWAAFGVLIQASPLTFWLGAFVQRRRIAKIGAAGYRAVASRRGLCSQLSRRYWPWAPVPTGCGRLGEAVVAAAFLLVLWYNISTLNGPWAEVREPARSWAYALRLDQRWDMFAPFPATDDGWFVVDGQRADGSRLDVLSGRAGQARFDKPAVVSASAPNQRWSKYMMNLVQPHNSGHRLYYGRYLCRRLNGVDGQKKPQSLSRFELVYMREDTLADHIATPERTSLWRHDCFGTPND